MKYLNGHDVMLFDVITNGNKDAMVVEITNDKIVISRDGKDADLALNPSLVSLKERINGDVFEYEVTEDVGHFVESGDVVARLPDSAHGYWECKLEID